MQTFPGVAFFRRRRRQVLSVVARTTEEKDRLDSSTSVPLNMFKVFILIALLAAVSAKVRPSFLNLNVFM
jgi:hypothetical protein